jgi:hypothetical protein
MDTSPLGHTIVIAGDDTVYRSDDKQRWRQVLGPPGVRLEDADAVDEERLLLDVEGFLEEMEDPSVPDERGGASDADDEGEDGEVEDSETDGLDSPDDYVSELADLYAEQNQGDGSSVAPRTGQLVWMSKTSPGLVLVERSDGLWRSDDHGHTWARTESLPGVQAFYDGVDQTVLAGTVAGLRISVDMGTSWQTVRDPISKIEVHCFAADAGLLYAGTSEGLYRSVDGRRWAKLLSRHDADMAVWSIAIDPHWEGGLWVAGPVGILRSDDGGEQLRSAGQNTLMGTVSLLPLEAPGHLLSAGIDGVWESLDGGLRWRPIVNGLPSPANRILAMGRKGPLVAGSDGLFGLRVAKQSIAQQPPEVIRDPVGGDMSTLVRVALNRPGMALKEMIIRQSIVRALLLPELSLMGSVREATMISADYDAEANIGSRRRSWVVGVSACFGGCGAGVFDSIYDDTVAYDGAPDALDEALMVVGGEVYDVTGGASLAPMAANVAQRVTRYRTDVAERVNELVLARHRLLEAGSVIRTLSLREQVGHELDVLESAAHLDVYTNGYFTRVLTGS